MIKVPPTGRSGARATTAALAVVAATALAGVAGYQALADTKPARHAAAVFQHGGWHDGVRGGWRGQGDMSDEDIDAKIDRLVAHAAIEIDATEAQRDQIAAIARKAAKAVSPLRDAMHADGAALHDILLADTVDPAAIEAIRAARLAEIDAKSKIVAEALADVAAILTPEQRRLAEERIKAFRDHRGGWRR